MAQPEPPPAIYHALAKLQQLLPTFGWTEANHMCLNDPGFAWHVGGRVPGVPVTATVSVLLPPLSDRLASADNAPVLALEDLERARHVPDADLAPHWILAAGVPGTTVRMERGRFEGYGAAPATDPAPPVGLLNAIAQLARDFVNDAVDDVDNPRDPNMPTDPLQVQRVYAIMRTRGLMSDAFLEADGFSRLRCCGCAASPATWRCEWCARDVMCADCRRHYESEQWKNGEARPCPLCIYLAVSAAPNKNRNA
jgi:hypothetical protein